MKTITALRSRLLSRVVLAGSLMAMLALLVSTSPAVAAPAPAWTVSIAPYPANFEPGAIGESSSGPAYYVLATNVGGAPTSGELSITTELPAGLTLAGGTVGQIQKLDGLTPRTLSCSGVEGGQAVTCSSTEAVAPANSAWVRVPVQVDGAAPSNVVAEAVVSGGGAATVTSTVSTTISASRAPFGFLEGRTGAHALATNDDGSPANAASSHPYQLTTGFRFPQYIAGFELFGSGGGVRNLDVSLPRGMTANPTATKELCTEAQLEEFACPLASQVGTVVLALRIAGINVDTTAIYNMVTPPGAPAEFGFNVVGGFLIHLRGHLRNDGEYVLAATSSETLSKAPVLGADVTLWGVPTDASHDQMRGACGEVPTNSVASCPPSGEFEVERLGVPLLTMPSECRPTLEAVARANSWEDSSTEITRRVPLEDSLGDPVGTSGCNQSEFDPSISSQATTTNADTPTGLDFDLHVPQAPPEAPLATATLKEARVSLPEGLSLNPSGANGLSACSQGEIKLDSEVPQTCPDAAKVGNLEVRTPLLDHPLPGQIYVATPFQNPFGSLLAIYLAIEDPQTGVIIKLAGEVTPDPSTGQLSATFEDNPDLPFEDFKLRFFNGPRGVLTTPLVCGTKTTTSTLTPWSTPEGADAHPASSFETSGDCASSEADATKAYSFTAGTASPIAGSYSPFVLRLSRPDGSQHLTRIETTLPEGLIGKLAGVPYCPEANIAQAQSREAPQMGRVEQDSPSCPQSSEVGTIRVTAGSGIAPLPVTGRAYWAGPYKGAPLSMVAIVPAVAGPFDLGTVVNRIAINVGTYDARIHAVSDPLPTIRNGIPLDVRSVEIQLDRSNFTLNPTSCEAKAIEASVTTQAGQTAPLNNRFQVGECGRLAFNPSLKISLKGATKRAGHPALKAVVTYPQKGEYANIASARVSLPHSEFLDQGNLDLVCKQADLAAGTCPKEAIYGKVKAWTPLLAEPLEGNVYLGVGFGYALPALVAELNGQIRVLLKGKVDTTKQAGIRNTFEAVPDAPVSRFVLEMKGGKKYGLLQNSTNICAEPQRADVRLVAQNGKEKKLKPTIANSCRGKNKAKHHKHPR